MEQLLQAIPRDMAVRIREEKPKSLNEASELADNYELAWEAEGGGAGQPLDPLKSPAMPPSRPGSSGQAYGKSPVGVQRSRTNVKGEIQCWECKRYGHMAVACRERKSPTKRANSKPVMVATQGPG